MGADGHEKQHTQKIILIPFCDTLRKHGSKVNYYYYAIEKGQLPWRSKTKWYKQNGDVKELIEKATTRAQRNLATISSIDGLPLGKKCKLMDALGLRHHRMNPLMVPFWRCSWPRSSIITPHIGTLRGQWSCLILMRRRRMLGNQSADRSKF